MSADFDSPATARLGPGRVPTPEPGRAEGDSGSAIAVSHTGELLELRLSEAVVSAGSDTVTTEVLGLYGQALARAQANATPSQAPGSLPRRR